MKDKFRPTRRACGGVTAHAGLFPRPGTPSRLSTAPIFGPALGGCTGMGLGAGQACGSASPTPLLDGTMCHSGTLLPSSEMLVGDEDLFRDVAK